MCLIITGTTTKPTLVELLAAEQTNPDGAGMAWTTKSGVEFRKGLSAEDVDAKLAKLPARTRWVVHFRFATVGDPGPGLCHPFPVAKDTSLTIKGRADRVLFHNGTVDDWKDKVRGVVLDPALAIDIPGGEWSDSRGIAWLMALNGSTRGLNFIDGKFVAMNRKGISIYPKNKSGWTHSNDMWFSNTYWRREIPSVVRALNGERQDTPDVSHEKQPLWWRAMGNGSGVHGRSLYDEAMDFLSADDADAGASAAADEAAAMDMAKPRKPRRRAAKKKATKKKAAPKRKPRKGLKLRQGR